MLIVLLAFPIWIYFFLKKKESELPQPTLKAKYDSVYQNVDYFKNSALAYTSYFLVRRFAFAAIIVLCGASIVLQVFLADIMSTLLLVFFLSVCPMNDFVNNAVQIFNEAVVLICIWLMFHWTQYVSNAQERYDLAWYFLYFVGFNVSINVLLLVYILTKKIY